MEKIGDYFDVDEVIEKLISAKKFKKRVQVLEERVIITLCNISKDLLLSQGTLLELTSPIKICGDIHGQFHDLLRLFELAQFPPKSNYLFLGDYVDRGRHSIETICLLLAYKIKYSETFHILRGNHECSEINRMYGFYEECDKRYSAYLHKIFNECFNCFPLAAIVESKIFCCHGGLSPFLKNMAQIRLIKRPIKVPESGLICDLLWSDPDEDIEGWKFNEKRGTSYIFGPDVIEDFVRTHGFELICRAHEVVQGGYRFSAGKKLVTVFSAPNYKSMKNSGAVMSVTKNENTILCDFQILLPK